MKNQVISNQTIESKTNSNVLSQTADNESKLSNTVNDTVKKLNMTISSNGLTTTYGKGENLTITLTHDDGTPIIGQHVAINLKRFSDGASKIYWATTDIEGVARLQINLYPGNYSSTYSFSEINGTSPIKVKIPITLSGNDLATTTGSGSSYTVNLTDMYGNALVNQIVNITLSKGSLSKTYQVITDINGIAKLAINLAAGNYNVTYSFNSDHYGSAINSNIINIEETNNSETSTDNESSTGNSSEEELPTITIKAKPSVGHSGYAYKWFITTFVNYCPLCHHYNTLTINPKGVYESELTCSNCDADYDGVTGRDKSYNPRAYLTTVTAPILA